MAHQPWELQITQTPEQSRNSGLTPTHSRDLNALYESNNPDWRVETSFTEIPYYEDRTEKLYTLTILGPDDKSYSLYEINQYLYYDYFKALPGAAEISDHMLPISDYCDARYDRDNGTSH